MHICFPYQSGEQFVSAASDYVRRFSPALTIINSTVVPGTTRTIAGMTSAQIAYSPIRGKHAQMAADIRRYTKFVASDDPDIGAQAERHFRSAGLNTKRIARTETLELAKLAETTYFGVLIAFAQELNRYAEQLGGDYDEAASFFDEVNFLPRSKYFPGFIGGHCVIPNIQLLRQVAESPLLQAVLDSNHRRELEIISTSQVGVRVADKV
jgi:UDP-N-acetyl-D-mannosaminuronate dehydrogenase